MIITTEAFIIVICVALCCASVYSYFYKKTYCGFVKKLIDTNAVGEENSVLLSKLGLSRFSEFFLKKALSSPTNALARVTSSMDDGKGHILVFLLPEKVEEAKKRFKDTKTSVLTVVVSIILCIIVAIFAIFIYPTVENIIYNARNDFETEENDGNYIENENNPILPEVNDENPSEDFDIPEENSNEVQQQPDESVEDTETENDKNEIPKIPEVGNRFE